MPIIDSSSTVPVCRHCRSPAVSNAATSAGEAHLNGLYKCLFAIYCLLELYASYDSSGCFGGTDQSTHSIVTASMHLAHTMPRVAMKYIMYVCPLLRHSPLDAVKSIATTKFRSSPPDKKSKKVLMRLSAHLWLFIEREREICIIPYYTIPICHVACNNQPT